MRTTAKNFKQSGSGNGEFLSRKDMAKKFRVTERTIDNWRKKYGMPHFVVGRGVRFKENDVDAWMKTMRRGGPVGAE